MVFRNPAAFCVLFVAASILAFNPTSVFGQTITVKDKQDANAAKDEKEDSPPKLVEVTLADGGLQLSLPETWKAPKKPRSRIVEREFAIPSAEGDKTAGRLTMMRSGGSIKLNVERWYGQFSQPDGKSTKNVAKVTTKKINEQEVTMVDISGTFSESMGGGPFAPGKTVKRDDYRMLAGIVQTKAVGQYFFKLYGPKKTIVEAEKHFAAMMNSVKAAEKRSK